VRAPRIRICSMQTILSKASLPIYAIFYAFPTYDSCGTRGKKENVCSGRRL
jgi:hypothetical protein